MRILVVSPYPPAKDGIGTYTQAMVRAFRARGHEAAVVVPRAQPGSPPEVMGSLGPRPADAVALLDRVAAWKPDLIHVQFAIAAFGTRTRALLSWLRMLRSASPVALVATLHEVTRDTGTLRGPGRTVYRALSAHCDRVIVHTHGALAALTGAVGVPAAKATVIPHPQATPPRFITSPADLRSRFGLAEADLLVAFGFIHVDKGLGDLVEALCLLRASGLPLDGVRLVIAGIVRRRSGLFRVFELRDKAHLAQVARRARRGGLGALIVRTGYVPEADVAGWFQAAAAIVLPYRRTEQSGVAGIADAFTVPVLASTAGGLGERYAGSPWTFPPRAPRELSRVLRRFLATAPADRVASAVGASAPDLGSVVTATLGAYREATSRTPMAEPEGSVPDAC